MTHRVVVGGRTQETQVMRVRLIGQPKGAPKYLSRLDGGTQLYIPSKLLELLKKSNTVLFTEGEFKALFAVLNGIPACGLQGVTSWSDSRAVDEARERGYETLDAGAIYTSLYRPLLREIPHILRYGKPIWDLPRDAYILGDSDLLWNPRSHGREQLELMAEAIRFRVAAKTHVGYCPPILEVRWLEAHGDRLVVELETIDKKQAAKLSSLLGNAHMNGRNPTEAIRRIAEILDQYFPEAFENLKANKTGLDDWIKALDGQTEPILDQILTDLADPKKATTAVTFEYVSGSVDSTVESIYPLLYTAPMDRMRIYAVDGKIPARIEWEKGRPVIQPFDRKEDLSLPLSSRVKFKRRGKGEELHPIETPNPILHAMFVGKSKWRETDSAYPCLSGIRTSPVVDIHTGQLQLYEEGYHDEYYWRVLDALRYKSLISDRPTDEEMRRAVRLFYGPFVESPWADDASASGVLAMALTLMYRDQMDIAPGFVVTAPQAGTGKSYVAEMVYQIAFGDPSDVLPILPTSQWRVNARTSRVDEEELSKAILSDVREKKRVIYFDNIPTGGVLGCAAIDALITNSHISGRILAQSKKQDVRVIATFIATGNNLTIVGDTPSRMVLLRQDRQFSTARFSRPKYEWLRIISREIIQYRAALLTIMRWGHLHREELEAIERELATFRFPLWNKAVRCLIVAAGRHRAEWRDGRRLTDPIAATATHNVDVQAEQVSSIFRALESVFGRNTFSVQDIVTVAKKPQRSEAEEALVYALDLLDHPSAKRIAYKLANLRGVVLDDLKQVHVGQDAHTKVHLYRMERGPKGGPGSTPPTTPTPEGPKTGLESQTEQTTPVGEAKAEATAEAATEAQAKNTQEPEPEADSKAPFLTTLDEDLRKEITEAKALALDTETTGLYSHHKPLSPSASTMIGDIPWREYKRRYGNEWDGTPRLRILSITLPSGRNEAFDLDGMSVEAKMELLRLCANGKVLVGHNLAFDLRWIRETAGDVWPARVLDTMLLTRSLAPDLSMKIHEMAGKGDEEARRLVEETPQNRACGVKLKEVAYALGLMLPEGKSWQKPEAWAPKTLTCEHYRYATGDTEVATEVLKQLARHIGIEADSAEAFLQACDEKRPNGWACYTEAFEPALRILAGIRDTGLPFDAEGAIGHITRLDEEIAQALMELVSVTPGLKPHTETIASGGLTETVKSAFVRAVATESPDIAREIVARAVKDSKYKGDLETAIENAWHKLMAGEDVSGLRIGRKELPEGAGDLKLMGPWEHVQEAVKRKAMLKTILDCVRENRRIHATISIAAITGRTISEEPNIQNFPRDPWFRELVRAKDGHVLVAADFSAVEMRIAAALAQRAVNEYGPRGRKRAELLKASERSSSGWATSKKQEFNTLEARLEARGWRLPLAEVFRAGIDPHVATALMLMKASHAEGLPEGMPDDVIEWLAGMTPEQRKEMRQVVGVWRQRAKAANFGLLYGQQAKGLHRYGQQSYGIQWSIEEAEHTREAWFNGYPDIHYWQVVTDIVSGRWLKYGKKYYTKNRYRGGEPELSLGLSRVSSTLSGRPLATFDRTDILNYQDQGSGAEIALKAMNLLPEEYQQCIVNFVHDELMLEVSESEAERASEALREAMIRAGDWLLGQYGIPTEVDVAVGRTWPKG